MEHIPVPFVDKDLCNSSAHYNGHLGLSDICTGSRTDRPVCKVCVVNDVIFFWITYPRVRYTKENIFSFFVCFRKCGRNQNSRYAILNSGVIISLKNVSVINTYIILCKKNSKWTHSKSYILILDSSFSYEKGSVML